MVVSCAVPGCKTKGTKGFVRFPKDREEQEIWLDRIGSDKLSAIASTDPNRLVNNYRICLAHFDDMCMLGPFSRNALLYRALPTLNLPGFFRPSDRSTCFMGVISVYLIET